MTVEIWACKAKSCKHPAGFVSYCIRITVDYWSFATSGLLIQLKPIDAREPISTGYTHGYFLN